MGRYKVVLTRIWLEKSSSSCRLHHGSSVTRCHRYPPLFLDLFILWDMHASPLRNKMSSSLPASRAPSPERACHQPSTPRHISSILRTNSIHRSETLNQVSSAARPGQEPLPQHPQPTSTSRHSFLTSDGFSPDCLNSTSEPTISSHIRHRSVKRTPSCPRAIRESASCATATRKPMHPAKVQRWAGLTRTVSDWDVLRRVWLILFVAVAALLTVSSRILNCGLRREIVTFTCMLEEHRVVVPRSASLSECYDRRSAVTCLANAMLNFYPLLDQPPSSYVGCRVRSRTLIKKQAQSSCSSPILNTHRERTLSGGISRRVISLHSFWVSHLLENTWVKPLWIYKKDYSFSGLSTRPISRTSSTMRRT